jgi:glycerol kinase
VKVLPYFKFYRGTEGCVAQFSASIAKIKILRAALNEHSAERCAVVEGARVEYDDVDDLRELEEMTEQERRDAEPSPVAS